MEIEKILKVGQKKHNMCRLLSNLKHLSYNLQHKQCSKEDNTTQLRS